MSALSFSFSVSPPLSLFPPLPRKALSIPSAAPSDFLGGKWDYSSSSSACVSRPRPLCAARIARTGGVGAAQTAQIIDAAFWRVSPMRLRKWSWVWRWRGALVDGGGGGGGGVGGVSGGNGRGRIDRGSGEFYLPLLLQSGTGEYLKHSGGGSGAKSFACHGASTGRGGAAQLGSSDAGSVDRALQALRQSIWPGFKRGLSQDVRRKREEDDGDWRYSPEWWGTQAGGWGHNEGKTVFEMSSVMGNGLVSVTSHPASTPSTRDLQPAQKHSQRDAGRDRQGLYQVLGYEWRVLRFNTVTRQSVAKIKALATSFGDVILLQQPNCIAFEYVKSMISAGLSAVSLSGLDLQSVGNGYQKMRILCIGLGGGSLPLFLAHNLPGATVEVVEIDAAVISAAVDTMGFPPSVATNVNSAASDAALGSRKRSQNTSKLGAAAKDEAVLWGDIVERMIVHENDGEAFVREQAQKLSAKKAASQYDLVFVDAYDGDDVVPLKLWDRSGPFLSNLSSLLNTDHGTVVVNLHTDSAPPSIFERISGKFGPGFDPTLPQGKRVQEAALAYRDMLLQEVNTRRAEDERPSTTGVDQRGVAFTVSVSLQGNVALVVSRGASLRHERLKTFDDQKANGEKALIQAFVGEAERLQSSLNIPFDMSKRILRGFHVVKSS